MGRSGVLEKLTSRLFATTGEQSESRQCEHPKRGGLGDRVGEVRAGGVHVNIGKVDGIPGGNSAVAHVNGDQVIGRGAIAEAKGAAGLSAGGIKTDDLMRRST